MVQGPVVIDNYTLDLSTLDGDGYADGVLTLNGSSTMTTKIKNVEIFSNHHTYDTGDGGGFEWHVTGNDDPQVINLSSGNFTAMRTVYAMGGNDWITGNNGDDYLHGGDGIDILEGRAGHDTLIGGAGWDKIDGGKDTDAASYEGSTAVTVDLRITGPQNPNGTGHEVGDLLISIENLIGSDGNDSLTGDDEGNLLDGGLGNDTLDGGAGADSLVGGAGNDTLVGDTNDPHIDGGEGVDTVHFGRFREPLQ